LLLLFAVCCCNIDVAVLLLPKHTKSSNSIKQQ
jgi:hypothetical protein